MSAVVLVHGAFRGGWWWGPVRRGLSALGHDVVAPSLTGMGDRAHVRPERIGLDTWVEDLVSTVTSEDLSDVVLVGHSQGGMVVAAAAGRLVDRLACVAFLDAPVPEAGERGVDLSGPRPAGAPPLPPPDTWIPPAAPAPGTLSPELTDWLASRLCATPFGPSLDPIDGVPATVPLAVAFCSGTPDGYPSTVTRARFDADGTPYTLLDAPHDVALARPDLVVTWLDGLTRSHPG